MHPAAPATPTHPTAALLGVPGLRWLWCGGLVSLVGTYMQFVALPYFVYERTGSTSATAVTAAAQALPGILLAPVAGAVADTHDSRRVFIAANMALTAVTLGFALTLIAPWWVVIAVALVQASIAQLVAPAELVLVPALVPAPLLPAANSVLGANNHLARLVGPAAGGLLYAVAGLPAVAVLNAATFAVAALMVSRVPVSTTRDGSGNLGRSTPSVPRARRPHPGAGWSQGWHEIRRHRLLVGLLVVFVLTGIGEGCVSALLAPYVQEVFGSSTALGLLLSCQATGGLVGALVVGRWVSLDRLPQVLGWSAVACGVLLAVMIGYPLLYPHLWPALLLIALAGLPFAAVAAAQSTMVQVLPHPRARGRVLGVLLAAAGAAQLLGILVSGHLADRTTVYLLIADAPCYLLAGLAVLLAHRGRRPRADGSS